VIAQHEVADGHVEPWDPELEALETEAALDEEEEE
jgi:hypothetical protein